MQLQGWTEKKIIIYGKIHLNHPEIRLRSTSPETLNFRFYTEVFVFDFSADAAMLSLWIKFEDQLFWISFFLFLYLHCLCAGFIVILRVTSFFLDFISIFYRSCLQALLNTCETFFAIEKYQERRLGFLPYSDNIL